MKKVMLHLVMLQHLFSGIYVLKSLTLKQLRKKLAEIFNLNKDYRITSKKKLQ